MGMKPLLFPRVGTKAMARVATPALAKQFEALFESGSSVGLTDRQLLERFNTGPDHMAEAAFATLITRHGPMVYRVCLQLLHDRHHAEDAFQAVFLVLARRARSIRDPEKLSNWLHGVALRTARCLRQQVERRLKREGTELLTEIAGAGSSEPVSSSIAPEQQLLNREQSELLHAEINRLPQNYRLPILLCYFQGLTLDEAAHQLAWPQGTFRGRLAAARHKLKRALVRRGVMLPSAILPNLPGSRPAAVHMARSLAHTTARAAMQLVAGEMVTTRCSTTALFLAEQVARAMAWKTVRLPIFTLATLLSAGTALGYLGDLSPTTKADPPAAPAVAPAHPADAKPGRMIVTGRVLDPDGKPVVGAAVDIMGRPRRRWLNSDEFLESRIVLGSGTSDTNGHLHIDAARSSGVGFFEVYAVSLVPGFGLASIELNPNALQPVAELRLRREQVIEGRLVDINGAAAAGVELKVESIGKLTDKGTYDGVRLGWSTRPKELRAWPSKTMTDQDGRFRLAGIGRDLQVNLGVRDLRFAQQTIHIETNQQPVALKATKALTPATFVEGRILAADTGQPIPHAVVDLRAGESFINTKNQARARANDRGHFVLNVAPGKYGRISVYPPDGQPYLVAQAEFEWTKGTLKKTMDIKLVRGVLIEGKVTEQGSGRPLEDAAVQYIPAKYRDDVISGYSAVVATKSDGSYQIAVSPGKGYLFIYGATPDYILKSVGSQTLHYGKPGGKRYYAHELIAYEAKAGEAPYRQPVQLRRGKTVKGRLIGPDGQTIDKAEAIALLHFNYFHLNWRGDLTIHVRDGQFELHGLDPEKASRVSFLDADHQWGATVELSGKSANEDLTVRLQPCGQAKVRLVGPDHKPIENTFPHLELIGTPGQADWSSNKAHENELIADAAYLPNLDRKHYWNGPRTNAQGDIILPDLIPGATYRISDTSTRNVPTKGIQIRKDFTVKPGETVDLGDILIEKPQQ
jgi:RNA polymerase sigma factor (sigma-70 family)